MVSASPLLERMPCYSCNICNRKLFVKLAVSVQYLDYSGTLLYQGKTIALSNPLYHTEKRTVKLTSTLSICLQKRMFLKTK